MEDMNREIEELLRPYETLPQKFKRFIQSDRVNCFQPYITYFIVTFGTKAR